MAMNFEQDLAAKCAYVEDVIRKYLPKEDGYQKEIMQAMKDHVVALATHVNGNHVIQCCLSVYPNYYCQVIYEEVMNACFEVFTLFIYSFI